jgi:hypothetical protein
VPEVQVTAHNLNKHADRATVSNTDGVFTFTNLEPGSYEFEAIKEGFRKSSARAQVGDPRGVSVDLPLQLAVDLSRSAGKRDDPPLTEREKAMLERIDRLERRLASMEAALISTDARGPQLQSGQLAPGPPRPGVGKTPGNRPLVASLNPVAALRAALSPERSQALDTAQTSTHQQSVDKSGRDRTPPTTIPRPQPRFPDALQAPEPAPSPDNFTPFAFGDFSWLNGSARTKETVLDTKFFTPEIRFDTHYMEDFNQPLDHTIVGSTESFRSGEVQIEQASVGADFHWQNVRGRILFMQGLFATIRTPFLHRMGAIIPRFRRAQIK